MKKRLLGKLSAAIALGSVLICSQANGQPPPPLNLVTATATTSAYGTGGGTNTSAFAFGNLLFNGNNFNPYISAWGNVVVWRIANPGSPSSFAWQGQFSITGASQMKVTMFNTGTPHICVVYRSGGSFYMSLYVWNTFTFTALGSPTLLTNWAGSRISIDVYGLGRVGIVWDEIDSITFQTKLKCKFSTGLGTAFTGNYTLAGTTGQTDPDIAMTRTGTVDMSYLNGNTVHAHIVALSGAPQARVITEYAIAVEDIILTSPAIPFTPFLEDVNSLGYLELNPIPSIDCPDFDYNTHANWAYTYVSDGNISARFSDYNAGTVTTSVLTDGSMGNFPITLSAGLYYANYEPTITYNNQSNSVYVGWRHDNYPALNTDALCVEVKTDGSALISPIDYLKVTNSTGTTAPVFSKHTMTASFLYATTLQSAAMTHNFHDWSSTGSFKPGQETGIKTVSESRIRIYPNPVADKIKVSIPRNMEHSTFNVVVTNVLGKIIYNEPCQSEQLGTELSQALLSKAAGTYLLRIQDMNSDYRLEEKLVKLH